MGKKSDKNCKALITDMNIPLGYNVGNSLEVIEAIETLKGNTKGNLLSLCVDISTEIVSLALNLDYAIAKDKVLKSISSGKALDTLSKMIEYQGGNANVVDDYSLFDIPKYSYEVKSKVNGYIHLIDSQEVGIVSLNLGAGRHTKLDSIDYSAGIVFNRQVGDAVSIGDTIATLYSSKVFDFSQAEDRLLKAITFDSLQPSKKDVLIEKV